ncbi:MAG TPA: ankyrin repeat domain-containing protein [Terracidiphilus sp.]|nr:ankyrin repeat domain-containing protein [Terracidiphilus sp.]
MKNVVITILFPTILLLSRLAAGQAAPGSLDDQLISAAQSGNTAMVQQLLDKGANIEARDGYGETVLIRAAEFGGAEVVKLLLDKGANIDARGKYGDTALIRAAGQGKADVVKLLLERGANIGATDGNGYTALSSAKNSLRILELPDSGPVHLDLRKPLSDQTEVVHMLELAVSQTPQTVFAESISRFQYVHDESLREDVIKAATALPTPPAIPDDAKQFFQQATAILKNIQSSQASAPEDLYKPIDLLRKALLIAPWWGNAYYNLSRALELSGQYDDAIKQLNYYLELNPSADDAADARAKIAVIQSEKENATQKTQANESVLAVKYVSGGVTRLRFSDAPARWTPSSGYGVKDLYAYKVSEESPFFANVFRMPNGYLLTISLLALSNNGAYTGDRIAVFAWSGTEGVCQEGFTFAFGEHSYTNACGVRYDVSVSNQNDPNAFVSVTYTPTGAAVTVPLALLYRGRALKGTGAWGGCTDGTVYQSSHDKGGEILHFDCSKVNAARDPNVNALGLTPTTVTPAPK